jgi:hypothetical protein
MELVFLPRRGLFLGDPEGRFTWLTAGIFVEICRIAAHGLNHELHVDWQYSKMYPNGDFESPQTVAALSVFPKQGVVDLDPELILKRQTSRFAYDGTACPPHVIEELKSEAAKFGHAFETRSDRESIRWVVELNKQALFHDLDHDGARKELIEWLRFDEREENLKRDGLSARCLTMNGKQLRSFFFNHRFWGMPVVRSVAGAVYKKTMKGIGTIGWLRGPYITIEDWVRAGTVMIRLWLILTQHGFYWHPYGSVITSEDARQNMIRYLKLPDEAGGKNMVWLLLRLGHSAPPPQSLRIPFEEFFL